MRQFIILLLWASTTWAYADTVSGLKVSAIAQSADDEESPFEFQAANKKHSCGGKNSAWFRVYAEHDNATRQRFALVQMAFEKDFNLTVTTDGCDGRYLKVGSMVISR
jgi:hypothetical protein